MNNLARTFPFFGIFLSTHCFAVGSMQSTPMDMGVMALIILGVSTLVVGRLAKEFTRKSPKAK